MYDYLLVGAGLFNAVFAHEAVKNGKTCLVLEKRPNIGGNCYSHQVEGIEVHEYGAHIFRTSDKKIWDYISQFAEFNNFINSPIAKYHNEVYNLPFNMNTFSKMWGIATPDEAKEIIKRQGEAAHRPETNLEDHAIALVGIDIYEKLIKGYTEKQWGRSCSDLPASIMRRIPLRFTYDNNYYSDRYQGIPVGGYTTLIEKLFDGCEIVCNIDYLEHKDEYANKAKRVVFTGTIDSYFDYSLGELEYRSLRFEHEILDKDNFQGVAVVNYTDAETPFTRSIEHKHFEFGKQKKTVVTREYPLAWNRAVEPYYPINDDKNNGLYREYQSLAEKEKNVFFGGRLGMYCYTDMQDTIKNAISMAKAIL